MFRRKIFLLISSWRNSGESNHAKENCERKLWPNVTWGPMGLLWRREDFPFNRTRAESRLQALKRRFNRVPGLEEKYWYVIDDYVARGYARQLSELEASKRSKVAWYLPYHLVLNVNKPNKVRVVLPPLNLMASFWTTDCTMVLISQIIWWAFSSPFEKRKLRSQLTKKQCSIRSRFFPTEYYP